MFQVTMPAARAASPFMTGWKPTGGPDPVLLMARYGTGASAIPALIDTPGAGNDNFIDQSTLTLAPGQTSRVMQLAWLNTDVTVAGTNGTNFGLTATGTGQKMIDRMTMDPLKTGRALP